MVIDAISLQVNAHRFASISDEMNLALVRTAYSTNIKDRRDCSAAIFTSNGRLVSQSAVGTPLHLGVLPYAVRGVLSEAPTSEMKPGDHYISNLPFPSGPGHLNDVTLVSPIFGAQERIIGFAGCSAHHVDVGGGAPGSMPFGVTEIFQEGLQIPVLKIAEGGKLNQDLVRLILQNVRTPHEVRGDLMAQVAANNVATNRLRELEELPGLDELDAYYEALFDYSRRRMAKAIEELPNGKWSFEDVLEGDGISDELIAIRATVEIAGPRMIVDFSETDDQVAGPLNCRPPSAVACVYYVALALTGGDVRANDGLFRDIEIRTRPGSLLEAAYPAAVCNANILTTQRIVDVLLGALAKGMADRVCAACSGTMNLLNIGGRDPRSGQLFNYIETYGGGQGALPAGDGASAIQTHMTNTRNASIEQIETAYPILVESYRLVQDSEGAGTYRGGLGLERDLRLLGEGLTLTLSSDRHRVGPWGLDGGLDGSSGTCRVVFPDGTARSLPSKITLRLPSGTRVISRTPGGGGRGRPSNRDLDAIRDDVDAGYISAARAAVVYGRHPVGNAATHSTTREGPSACRRSSS